MSRAVVTKSDFENNQYEVNIPGFDSPYPAIGITKDEIEVGSVVEVVDINNESPDNAVGYESGLRIAPNVGEYVYSPTKEWKLPEEFLVADAQASLMKAFFFSSKLNPRWQAECPLYRSGIVTEIIDANFMNVRIETIVSSFTPIFKCNTEYMTCNTTAFSVDDVVTVMFVNQCLFKPKVIGFWSDPKYCTPYLFIKIDRRYPDQDLMTKELVMVWDILNNSYAEILDQNGDVIEMPCRLSDISWFLERAENVGKDLWSYEEVGLNPVDNTWNYGSDIFPWKTSIIISSSSISSSYSSSSSESSSSSSSSMSSSSSSYSMSSSSSESSSSSSKGGA